MTDRQKEEHAKALMLEFSYEFKVGLNQLLDRL